ncbi:MAG: ABC transporter substrate-binding protein [Thermomicrobiales bacterium]|nr:ABC transporter substrate-binding protein [Thermomicrobiales bacterium]
MSRSPRTMSRRTMLTASLGAGAALTLPRYASAQTPAAGGTSATDVVGRNVMLPAPAERIVVTSRSGLYSLAILEAGGNPFQRVVAWNDDLRTTDLDAYHQYLAKFPEAADLPNIGDVGASDFNAEKIIELEPDLLVVDLGGYQDASEHGMIDILEAAGIAVVVLDFREHMLENTIPSVQALGRLTGKLDTALEFSDFYLVETNKVYDRIAAIDPEAPRPSAFIQRAPGLADVGLTFGPGNLGEFLTRAGGVNWAEQFVPTVHGTVNPEQILVGDFDLLIMTGANWTDLGSAVYGTFISMGYEATMEEVLADTTTVIEDFKWSELPAVAEGRVHDIWHQFYVSPYAFIAFQAFAKWLHPDLFEDVDPNETFRALHERFLPLEYKGVFFADYPG